MKKSIIIIIISVVLLLVIGIISFGVYEYNKYSKKEILTKDKFQEVMTNYSLNSENITEEFKEKNEVESILYSSKEDIYEIYLLTFKNNNDANLYFKNMKNYLEQNKGNTNIRNNFKIHTYAKYEITTNGTYSSLIRNKNTVLYIISNKDNKKEIKNIIKELNY